MSLGEDLSRLRSERYFTEIFVFRTSFPHFVLFHTNRLHLGITFGFTLYKLLLRLYSKIPLKFVH